MLNALTVDVEDYYHVTAFDAHIRRDDWDQLPSRVERNTRGLLDLLDSAQVRGTFFVLGWVARKFPHLVREIIQAGHEIGSHSYWHRLIYQQTPDEFQRDVRLARDVLQQITGEAVVAYRAPTFSITKRTWWALEILAAEGFRVDSSIFPIRHDRYGIPSAACQPHRLSEIAADFWEVPLSVVSLGGYNIPVAGGGYFRLYPLGWTLRAIQRLHRGNTPFIFYIHPWELDPEQPRLAGGWWRHWRHYVNLRSTRAKLERMVRSCAFGSISDVLQQAETASKREPPEIPENQIR